MTEGLRNFVLQTRSERPENTLFQVYEGHIRLTVAPQSVLGGSLNRPHTLLLLGEEIPHEVRAVLTSQLRWTCSCQALTGSSITTRFQTNSETTQGRQRFRYLFRYMNFG